MSLLSMLPFWSCLNADGGRSTVHIVSFQYHYDGTIGGNSCWYKVKVKDGQPVMTIEELEYFNQGERTDTVGMDFMEALEEVCRKHKVWKFDGFKKTNPYVCDGSGYSLYIKYDNGKSVDSYGMNMSPDGYHAFAKEIYALFEPYCEKTRIHREE